MGIAGGPDSSSGEEDGDAEWKAAIDSVAAVDVSSSYGLSKFQATASNGGSLGVGHSNHEDEKKTKAPGIKLYQIKAQKLLDDLLDKNIEMVKTHIPDNDNHQSDGGLVKLFRKAPPGMRLDPIDQDPGPQKKPKIIPGEDIDEKSKKFRRNIQSVAVNGSDVVAAARLACQSSLARWEARDTAAKAAAKREEERVAELKRIRGEKWLPSVAREMKVSFLTNMKLHASEHLDGNIVSLYAIKFLLTPKSICFHASRVTQINGVACLLAQAFAFKEAVHAIIVPLVFAEPEGFIEMEN